MIFCCYVPTALIPVVLGLDKGVSITRVLVYWTSVDSWYGATVLWARIADESVFKVAISELLFGGWSNRGPYWMRGVVGMGMRLREHKL